MKKLITLFGLLMACGTAPHQEVAKTPAPLPSCADAKAGEVCQPAPIDTSKQVLFGKDWRITLIGTDWEQKPTPNAPATAEGVLYVAKDKKSILSVFRDQIDPELKMDPGTFLAGFVAKVESEGAVVDEKVIVQLMGKQFSRITVRKMGVKMRVWMHLENNVAHVILCGGLSLDRNVEVDCTKMAETFQIELPTKSRIASKQEDQNPSRFQEWVVKSTLDVIAPD